MKKMKCLAWLLLLVMLFSLCPTAALADGEDDGAAPTEEPAEQEPAPVEEPEEEPEPTATPEPTEEPEPTETPAPVEEPEATATPEEEPETAEEAETTEEEPETTEETDTAEETRVVSPVLDGEEETEDDIVASGTCGPNLTWTLDDTGTLTISGEGAMTDYSPATGYPSWTLKRIAAVVIESGVTSIGSYAFYNCTTLEGIVIPDSVTSIGGYAFSCCRALESVTIGSKVETIGYYAFTGCTALENALISDGVEIIDNHAFFGCTALENVTIGNKVTSIGSSAFSDCTALKSVYYTGTESGWSAISRGTYNYNLTNASRYYCVADHGECGESATWRLDKNGVLTIDGSGAMTDYSADNPAPWSKSSEKITAVVIESGVTAIGAQAFAGCSVIETVYCKGVDWEALSVGAGNETLTSATCYASENYGSCGTDVWYLLLENGTLLVRGNGSMTGSVSSALKSSVESAEIGTGVTGIGSGAFSGCTYLEAVTIGGDVTSIYENPFSGCKALESITVAEENKNYVAVDDVLFTKDMATLVCFPREKSVSGTYVIPDSVTSIGNYAFNGCILLDGITLPENLKNLGNCAFYGCTYIDEITIPDGVMTIGYGVFYGCKALTSITIPDSVTSISTKVFYGCTALKSVAIGIGIETVAGGTFEGCTKLASITLPDSVTSIESSAFSSCSSLKDVYYGGTQSQWSKISIDSSNAQLNYAAIHFSDGTIGGVCGTSLTWTLDADGVLTIDGTGEMTSYNSSSYVPWYSCHESIQSVVVGDKVRSIGSHAFGSCTKLESVTIGSKVAAIGTYAFYNCTALESIVIPDSVTSIGSSAFYNCTALESVTLGNKVRSIGNYAFQNCTALESITIPDSVTSIGDAAFYSCTSLESIVIPDSVTSIGTYAFQNCTALESIVIPDSVTSIGTYAFHNCTALESIVIPDSVTSIGYCAFSDCKALESITIPDSVTSIGSYAFCNCTALESIVIPDSVTSIGDAAFYSCTSLESIVMPNSVKSIDYSAFYNCKALKSVYYGGTKEDRASISIGSSNASLTSATWYYGVASGSCGSGVAWTLKSDGTLVISGSGAIADYSAESPAPWSEKLGEIKAVEIGQGVTGVGAAAFSGCAALESVTLAKSVAAIGENAFSGCAALETVDFGGTSAAYKRITVADGNGAFTAVTPTTQPVAEHEHTWDDGEITTEPTYDEEGVKTFHCTFTDCEETKTEPVAKKERVPVAMSGTAAYMTLAAAVEAVEAGNNILLRADAENAETVTVNKAISIANPGFTGYTILAGADVDMSVNEYAGITIYSFTEKTEAAEPAAQIGGKAYDSVAAALLAAKSGETVKLVADSNEPEATLLLNEGVTLDLGTYTLTAKALFGVNGSYVTGTVYSATGDHAELKVNTLKLGETAPTQEQNGTQYNVLPIKSTDSAYVFTLFGIKEQTDGFIYSSEDDSITYKFGRAVTGDVRQVFLQDGSSDNALEIRVQIRWEDEEGIETTLDYLYKDEFVKLAMADNSTKVFGVRLVGMTELGIGEYELTKLTVTAMAVTDSGPSTIGPAYSIS